MKIIVAESLVEYAVSCTMNLPEAQGLQALRSVDQADIRDSMSV